MRCSLEGFRAPAVVLPRKAAAIGCALTRHSVLHRGGVVCHPRHHGGVGIQGYGYSGVP